MNRSCLRFFQLGLPFFLLITFPNGTWGAELTVQIRSPKDGSQITQEQDYLLVSGKVALRARRSPLVDIFVVLDLSNSTAQYSGVEFSDFSQFPDWSFGVADQRTTASAVRGNGTPGRLNLRNSILAAEIVASRRLLTQLNPETTRVGVITFADKAWLSQPLTHNFAEVRRVLDSIYKSGPLGGTNMVDAIRVATDELLGKGESEKYLDSIKALLLMTDGFPTSPDGGLSRPTQTWPSMRLSWQAKQESTFTFLLSVKKPCPILELPLASPGRVEEPTPPLRGRPMFWRSWTKSRQWEWIRFR